MLRTSASQGVFVFASLCLFCTQHYKHLECYKPPGNDWKQQLLTASRARTGVCKAPALAPCSSAQVVDACCRSHGTCAIMIGVLFAARQTGHHEGWTARVRYQIMNSAGFCREGPYPQAAASFATHEGVDIKS